MIFFIALLFLNLWWLTILIIGFVFFYVFSLKLISVLKFPILRRIAKPLLIFLFILSIAISTKLFVGDIYKIPSASMNNTLYTNDVILVNKLKYGPKLPRSPFEIPWVNIAFYFNDTAKQRLHKKWWPYKRWPGTTSVKNGDVVVFTMFKKDMVIVKRCMGIAGDTLSIKQGDVYINGNLLSPSKQVLNTYEFSVNNRKAFYNKLDSIGLDIALNRTSSNHFSATLSFQEKRELEQLEGVNNLKQVTDTLSQESTAYPNSPYNRWNRDEYGSFVVPKKGMTINLIPKTYALYHKAIQEHEHVIIEEDNDKYIINGKEVLSYTFKQDYYFMMGDNRKGSMDSRVWGIVPEERIIGKVQCVLWSNYQDEFQWSRLLKAVK